MSLEYAINLSYAAAYVLFDQDNAKIKDTNVFRLWRSIFEDLGQLLQDVIARQGRTDLSEESVDWQIRWMDYMDTGKRFSERNNDDDAAYVHWSQTFDFEVHPGQAYFDLG